MTFLELAKRLRQESGLQGNGPSTVVAQTGMLLKIVTWINQAWVDIQNMRSDWSWMWGRASLSTVADQSEYAITAWTDTDSSSALTVNGFSRLQRNTLKIYLLSAGQTEEGPLLFMEYHDWQKSFGYGSPVSGTPTTYTVLPNGKIKLSPPPDAVYYISCDYFKAATEMAIADASTPDCPVEFHHSVWAKALLDYAIHDEAISLHNQSLTRAANYINRLDGAARQQIVNGAGALDDY